VRIVDQYWLPSASDLNDELRRIAKSGASSWGELVRLANTRLDFLQTNRLDKISQKFLASPGHEATPCEACAWPS